MKSQIRCIYLHRHRKCESDCSAAGRSHQSALLKVGTALFVEFGPMAVLAPRREPLCQSSVGQALQCGVNPSETERLFHHVQIRQAHTLWLVLPAIHGNPATPLCCRVLLKPLPELTTLVIFQQPCYFHCLSTFSNHLDLDQCAFGQGLDRNGRTGWIRLGEELGIDSVHVSEVPHIGHKDRRFYDTLHG